MPYDLDVSAKAAYRSRSLWNLLHMGHCAPTVMQTLLDVIHHEQTWPVRLAAGLPGGIGNTGGECGGLTSPLIVLGLRHGLRDVHDGLPVLFDLGHAYYRRFANENAAALCRDVQNPGGFPARCIHAMRCAPGLLADTQAADSAGTIPADARRTYARLYLHLTAQDFHCAHAVFQHVPGVLDANPALLDAAAAFVGGTLFMGLTCSAFAAGVMAIGLKIGEIERNPLRVIRMLALLMRGSDNAFDDDVNKFHRSINTGHRLSAWFDAEFGSLQCRAITCCDFASMVDVESYIAAGCAERCREIARRVAERVEAVVAEIQGA